MPKTRISCRQLASQVTLRVQLTGAGTHKVCMALGLALIRLGCAVIGIGYERTKENTDGG